MKRIQEKTYPYPAFPNDIIHCKEIERFIKDKNKILLIGGSGGRDFGFLKAIGADFTVLDIVRIDHPNSVCQSIEERTPFSDNEFDGIIFLAVLEHLVYDIKALRELRRILAPDGRILMSVPLGESQDKHPGHIRIHSDKTVRRLSEAAGFETESFWVARFCIWMSRMIYTQIPLILMIRTITLLQLTAFYIRSVYKIEKLLVSTPPISYIYRLMPFRVGFFILKRGAEKDIIRSQIEHYSKVKSKIDVQ